MGGNHHQGWCCRHRHLTCQYQTGSGLAESGSRWIQYFVQVVGIYLNLAIFATWKSLQHGLTNYIDTKAKCHHLKNWPVNGLCGRCLFVWGPPYTLYSAKLLEERGIDESRHGSRARPRHRRAFLFWFKLEPRTRRGISNFAKTYWTQSRRVVFQNRTRTLDRFRGINTPCQPP